MLTQSRPPLHSGVPKPTDMILDLIRHMHVRLVRRSETHLLLPAANGWILGGAPASDIDFILPNMQKALRKLSTRTAGCHCERELPQQLVLL